MRQNVLGIKKHVHTIQIVKDLKTGESEESRKRYANHNSFSVENCTADLTSNFQFTEYAKSYAYYPDGDVEYVHIEGTLYSLHLQLTIDVFSCYCEPLNEKQDPPF